MSRHKNQKFMIEEGLYGDEDYYAEDYGDEYGAESTK